MSPHFCPAYPKPRANRVSVWSMFFSARRSWMDSLYERSYRMQMGEVHLPGLDLYMVNEPALVRRVLDGQVTDDSETLAIFDASFTRKDFAEGAAAFAEKRKPDFR